MSAPELKPCPFCKGGETRIDPQGQTWRGQGYSDPICWRLVHFCKGILPDDYVTNRMELRARTQDQCIEAWNTRADLCTPTDERVKALEAENARLRDELSNAASHVGRALDALTSGPFDASDPRIEALSQYADFIRAALRDMGEGK